MPGYTVNETTHSGEPPVPLVTLTSPSGLTATFAPRLGMVGTSLEHAGEELLVLPGGLEAYAKNHATLGIPLLHPWANRLARCGYTVAGAAVAIDPTSPLVHLDGQGRPIHGLVAACPGWEVTRSAAGPDSAALSARLDFAARPELLEYFPFPHTLDLDVTLEELELTVTATLTAGEEGPVPLAFGWHPYFALPDIPRRDWVVSLPAARHLLLDDGSLPTGASEEWAPRRAALHESTFDDLFAVAPDAAFVLEGGGRRLTVQWREGYHYAVVYAPATLDTVCFEPMTAPTNPFDGPVPPRLVPAGESARATFSVSVTPTL